MFFHNKTRIKPCSNVRMDFKFLIIILIDRVDMFSEI